MFDSLPACHYLAVCFALFTEKKTLTVRAPLQSTRYILYSHILIEWRDTHRTRAWSSIEAIAAAPPPSGGTGKGHLVIGMWVS